MIRRTPQPLAKACWKNGLRFALAVCAGLGWVGCATTADVLNPGSAHGQRAADYRSAVMTGDPARLLAVADRAGDRIGVRDDVLYAMEQGRLLSLAGASEASIDAFQLATDRFEEERMRPAIAVSEGFFNATALATNDLALPYRPPVHERLMVYNFLALEQLRSGRLDFAQIALNGADAEQAFWRDQSGALEAAAERQASQAGFGSAAVEQAVGGAEARLRASARTEQRPYQSALTSYLMGVLFAVEGDADRATIALRQAATLYPENAYILEALRDRGVRAAADDALVVVVLGEGWVPARETLAIPFFWDHTILQVVMPFYPERTWGPGTGAGLSLVLDGQAMGETALIADLGAAARVDLADRYFAIFLRQVLRMVAKYQVQQRLERENPWAGLAAQIFNLITDKADERSWLTLPERIEVAHFSIAPGFHELALTGGGEPLAATGLELPPGSTLFALVNRTGGTVYHDFVLFDAAGKPRQVTASPHPTTTQP